jgi:dTDP-4-dehydrorhamnose reductase
MTASASASVPADPMTDILITGAAGQIGRALSAAAWPAGVNVIGLDRSVLDLVDTEAADACIAAHQCRLVINAAAYTAVDRAESDTDAAYAANASGVAALAASCARHGAALIHLSTDYVFDGTKAGAYTEDDTPTPLGVYGRSKLAGEEEIRKVIEHHVILRTSWVFGAAGRNFVKTMLRLGAQRFEVQVVDDQIGCPTEAADIAAAIVTIAGRLLGEPDSAPAGTYNFCGRPPISWYGFATAIFTAAASHGWKAPVLRAVPSTAFPLPARRPANSVLDCRRIEQAFGIAQPLWSPALNRVIAGLKRDEVLSTA